MTCAIEGCANLRVVKGLCNTHYLRFRRWGSYEKHKQPARVTLELLLRRGRVDQSQDCWIWNSTLREGYGCIGVGGRAGKVWQAHRLAYTLVYGEVPEGLVLHHECETPRCVNPNHLALITRADHARLHHIGRKRAA